MTPDQKVQYDELETTATALREKVEQSRTQIDHLSREKDEFAKEISGSQVINNESITCAIVTLECVEALIYSSNIISMCVLTTN